MNEDTSKRLAALEARIKDLEDHIALFQTLSTYGPAVDSLQHDEATKLWTDDGIYSGDSREMRGRAEIKEMLDGPDHRSYVAQGCSHIMSMPLLKIEGDRAVGLGYHQLFRHTERGFELFRLTVSRWDWVRAPEGWKAVKRSHRLLNGNASARELLRTTYQEIMNNGQGGKVNDQG